MSRIQSVRDNWTEITDRLKADKQELAQFLRFSAGMYKQSFSDTALIYQQNPNATKVAELETWNKLGRFVNRGERSVAVFGEDNKCRYLFDVAQTNGKRLPELWKLTEDLSAELTQNINAKYGKECKNIQEVVATMLVDSLKIRLPEVQQIATQMKLSQADVMEYQKSLVSAIRFMVSNRAELNSDMKISGAINLNAVDLFKNNRDLIRFCDVVNKTAKDTLLEMEREIVNIYKQRREKSYELQLKSDRAVQPDNSVHKQSEGTVTTSKADRQMGEDVAGLGENRVSDRGDSSRDGGQVASDTERNRQGGREPVSRVGREVSTGEPASERVSENSGVGETENIDTRTSSDERGSVSSEGLAVQELIERYNNADFNRRLDSFEIAGRMFSDTADTKLDPIAYFNKFEAENYSAVQGEEIRNIIESAMQNREIALPKENEPLIIENEPVEVSELPPLLDEKLMLGVVEQSINREDLAKFFADNEDLNKRAEFMKNSFASDVTQLEIDGISVGYKANENGLQIWEGDYLSRTKESGFTWDYMQNVATSLVKNELQKKAVIATGETLGICGFADNNGVIYAEYLQDDTVKSTAIEHTDDGVAYVEANGKAYKLNDVQNYDLEQFELFRTPVTHDINGYYADDLDAGDTIKIKGDDWNVVSKKDYSIKIENSSNGTVEMMFGGWQEKLTKMGFEYVPEKVQVIEPLFAEPIKGEQMSLFGEPVPIEQTSPKVQKKVALPSYEITQDMIDYALKCGSNEPKSLERIVAQFQKDKSALLNAEFLKNEFGVDGRGYKYVNAENTYTALVSAWFDKEGVTFGAGNTAFNDNSKVVMSWQDVSKRMLDLLEKGEFVSQDVIDRSAGNELKDISEKLWYLHQDSEIPYFIPETMFKGGFPDSTARIATTLTDKETVQSYADGLKEFIQQYEENRDVLRFHFHKPKELLEKLKDLQLERKEFIAKSDFDFKPQFFITEDEKDKLLIKGSGVQDGKFRIEEYFKGEHTLKDKSDFLKHEYGDGGSGRLGFNTWHDSTGLKIQKGVSISNPDCEITMKWNEVAERIDKLIADDKYITQNDIDERIRHAKYTLENRSVNSDVDKYAVEKAQRVLNENNVKSPAEMLIEKAESLGVPVEMMDTPLQEKAVFMDKRDESFIAVLQTDKGVDYSIFSPDLSVTDSGVWSMEEGIDLKNASAELLGTSPKVLVELNDYDKFINLAYFNTELDIPTELARMKSEILPKIEQVQTQKPEKITVATNNMVKTGEPVTYSFNQSDVVGGGAKTKFKANVDAIQMLQKLENENRYATLEEQAIMAKYVGWGGIPQAFTTDRVADNVGGNLLNSAPTGWENEQKQLRELLSSDEYKTARASTLTSFYTPPEVTDGVYQALSQFGFEGGNVLEPSMGVGNFFAKMPNEMRDNSSLYGVELDSVSGRIAQQLYPKERIQIKGFEQTNFNNNSFDVVIGNIPFGDYRVSDKAYDKHNFKIHDYFAAKAVDKVKPGGVVALVTSKFTMDKQNEKARRYLAERCDLLGAVRLPNTAFQKNAGTEVTTDILFLKKRDALTVEVPDWVHMSQTEEGIPCNQYFVDNPDMVLGKMDWDERMRGKYGDDSKITTCIADDSIPLSEQLKTAVSKISGSIETIKNIEQENDEREYISADPSVRNFTHTVVDGNLYFRENEIMTKVLESGKTLDRMMGLHQIRQATMAVIDAQAECCSDEELSKLQGDLNSIYDKFKKAYGNITDSANERCFREDDDYNTLAALEIVDAEKKTVEKAEIFSKRTIQPEVEITSVDTPQEALQVSIDRIGKVDIQYMAELVGKEPEKVIEELGNDVFRNPEKVKENDSLSGYEEASEYLSGNVREKLKTAESYAKHIDSSFEKNVLALQKVIPKNLEASEITVRIGANWVDVDDYNKFLKEFARANTGMWGHPVTRTKMGEYKIEGKYQDKSVAANETYGTSRMSSYHIFENLLNQRDVVIRDRKELDGKVYYEVNAKETQLAKEKARQMKEGFKEWLWKDISRREKYVEKYNDLFNAIRGREYDGSHQTFPGMNPAIKLRPHQENAVLRGKLGGNTLLAHCVGAGKSFEMIATTMEKKRLGLINKGCVVVPKHLTLQTASEWMRLYPNAKLLVARPEDFTKDNRQKFIARCVTGDYDAVVMSFTQFERIPMSDEYRKQFMERELNEIMDALEDVDSSDRVSVKALEREKMKIEERLEKLLSSPKDSSLCFEKLGFDYLVCDEAHNYKNCFVTTKMSNVAGVQTTAAQKSEDMLMKTQYLNDKYDCNNILFATGTPIITGYLRSQMPILRCFLIPPCMVHNYTRRYSFT